MSAGDVCSAMAAYKAEPSAGFACRCSSWSALDQVAHCSMCLDFLHICLQQESLLCMITPVLAVIIPDPCPPGGQASDLLCTPLSIQPIWAWQAYTLLLVPFWAKSQWTG